MQSAYSAAIASISSNHLPSTVSAIITVDAGSFPPSILRRMARLATTWLAVGQERIDLDQMLDAEAGGGEHLDDVAPGLLALRLETFGHAAVRFSGTWPLTNSSRRC